MNVNFFWVELFASYCTEEKTYFNVCSLHQFWARLKYEKNYVDTSVYDSLN